MQTSSIIVLFLVFKGFLVQGAFFVNLFVPNRQVEVTTSEILDQSAVQLPSEAPKKKIILSETPDLERRAALHAYQLQKRALLQQKYFVKEHDSMEKISAEQSLERTFSNFLADQISYLRSQLPPNTRAYEFIFVLILESVIKALKSRLQHLIPSTNLDHSEGEKARENEKYEGTSSKSKKVSEHILDDTLNELLGDDPSDKAEEFELI